MNKEYAEMLANIDLWVKVGAIDYDRAKAMAKPHIDKLNARAAEIAKRHGLKPYRFEFHHFVH